MNIITLKKAKLIGDDLVEAATSWRRDLHQIPELCFKLYKTHEYIINLLDKWNIEYSTGYAETGIVVTIHGKKHGKTIAFRCDMDALPMVDESDSPWKSQHDGCSHACGHDGHMAITLAAIHHFATQRDFNGTIKVLFQPNEETGQGAKAMMKDGVYEDHPYSELFGFHNMPRLQDNTMQVRYGATTGAGETFVLSVTGKSGHSSVPHKCINPINVVSEIISRWHDITTNVHPDDTAVIAVCKLNSGSSMNGIPEKASAGGSMRYFEAHIADYMREEMHKVAQEICKKYGATHSLEFEIMCPATINTIDATKTVIECGKEIYGTENVVDNFPASPGGEDMSFFVTDQVKEVSLFMIGTKGENLHTTKFDFDDSCIKRAISMLINVAYHRLSK